jgi:transcriptional regulator with XRE-family HTH domain
MDRLYGTRLRAVREERGLRQVDVAAGLDMSAGGYSSVERGKARIFLSDVPKYADVLGVDVGYLTQRLGLAGEPSSQRDVHAATCAELLAQLEGEPAEVVEDVIAMFRLGVHAITRRRDNQRARDN